MSTILISHVFKMEDGDAKTIANVYVRMRGEHPWMDDLWVAPNHRKQGLARQLIERVLDFYASMDLYLAIEPYTDTPLSIDDLAHFYASCGFEPTSVPGVLIRPADSRKLEQL